MAEKETVVTPEMIESGVSAMNEFDLTSVVEGWDSKHDVVRAILEAALKVQASHD